MKPPYLPSLFALLLAAILGVLPSALHADTSSPMYGGSLYIHNDNYEWVSASEDGTYRYDEYSGPNGSVTVTGMIGFPNLASVSGSSSYGTVHGHLQNGSYGDNYWETGMSGSTNWERYQASVDFVLGELHWVRETSSRDWMGNESSAWSNSDGNWGTWSRSGYNDSMGNSSWSESWDGSEGGAGWRNGSSSNYYDWYGNNSWSESWDGSDGVSGWRNGGSSVEQTPSGALFLFGQSFELTSRNSWWETGSDGANNGGESCSYSSVDGSFSINSSYDNAALTGHTLIEGTDPDVGSFEAEFPAWFTGQGMLDGVVWDARSGESFGPSQFWVDGWLVTWQGGTLSSDSTVVDTYAGELFTVTLTGPAREFALGNATASLAVNGAGAGTVDLNGTWSLNGWTVSTTEPELTSTTEPFFLPAALSLYVNGAEYAFEASFTDAGGGRRDVYRNAALGRLALNGQTAGTANVVGNSGAGFFRGSLTGGIFGATLPVAVEVSASPPPVVFEPVPLWVRGVFYGTRVLDVEQVPTNTFTNADGTASLTFTEGANPGEWDVAGADAAGQPTFSRTLTSLPTGVFLVTGPQGESLPGSDRAHG